MSSLCSDAQHYEHHFSNCNVSGSVTIYDYKSSKWIFTDSSDAHRLSLPASTFKIINTLIALELKVLKDENEILKFPGIPDTTLFGNRQDTYHDMALDEAFKKSVIWFYYDLAEKIGRKNYKKYLRKTKYGNANFTQSGIDFWNFGSFGISPVEQIEFLRRLYEHKEPFSKRSYDILKKVMLHEKTETYSIYAKSGWERNQDNDVGWWVGYVTTSNNDVYFFATRLVKPRSQINSKFSSCRKQITLKVLNDTFKNLIFDK